MQSILKSIMPRQTTQKRVIFVGTRMAGKTASLGGLALTCDIMSYTDKNFSHWIDERRSGVRQVPSELCQGFFPEATPPGFVYEADLYLTWMERFGDKSICLPFCETAGEDIQNLIGPYQKSQYHKTANWEQAEVLNKYICDSNGYVLVLPVPRTKIPGIPQMDNEPEALLQDPDVNVARILQAIYRHKAKSRSPAIEGIAVLLTKYDMVDVYLKGQGMSLYDPEGSRLFMNTYFRQTSGLLKHYGMDKVKFFPVHFQVEKVKKLDGTMEFAKWENGRGYKIALDLDRNLPIYSEQSFINLIHWIKETFVK